MHKHFWGILSYFKKTVFILRRSDAQIFFVSEHFWNSRKPELVLYNDDEDDWCWFTPVTIFNCYFKLSHRVLTCRSHKHLRIGGEIWKVSRNVRENKNSIHIGIIDIIIVYNRRYQVAERGNIDSPSVWFNLDV